MVKVTLNENLVPSRHAYVKDRPNQDLVCNVLLARKLIRASQFLFQLKKGSAVYRGFVYEHSDGFFTIKLLQDGVLVRSLVLACLGYAGELMVDVEDLAEASGYDVLGSLAADPALHLAASA